MIIDRLFAAILILNATGLFVFLAPQFDTEIGHVSVVLLAINLLYLIVNGRHLATVLLEGGMGSWLVMIFLWPLFTIVYAPSLEIRQVGLQLSYISLLLGVIVYTMVNGLPAARRVIAISLAVTLFGQSLSMIMPQYFERASELTGFQIQNEGRPFGFLLEPNRLAVTIGFLFIGWHALWKKRSTIREVAVILSVLFAMLLTGSRAGMLIVLIVLMFILLPSSQKQMAIGRLLFRGGVLIACLTGAVVGMRDYLSHIKGFDASREELVNRMEAFLSFKLTSTERVIDDGSIQARLTAQEVYWALFQERPWLGHGLGANAYYQENGRILKAAHNDALACATEYGMLYPLAFGLLMLQFYRARGRRNVEQVFQTQCIGQFCAVVGFLFLATGDVLDNRALYLVWGTFFAAVYFPDRAFRHDEGRGQLVGSLSCPEIATTAADSRYWPNPSQPLVSAETGLGRRAYR